MKKAFHVLVFLFILGFLLSLTPPGKRAVQYFGRNLKSDTIATPDQSITISNFAFSTASLTIPKGTKVIWRNLDSAPHTVTSSSGTVLGSPTLNTNDTFSFTFLSAGTFSYKCNFHSSMTATIIVSEPAPIIPVVISPPTPFVIPPASPPTPASGWNWANTIP